MNASELRDEYLSPPQDSYVFAPPSMNSMAKVIKSVKDITAIYHPKDTTTKKDQSKNKKKKDENDDEWYHVFLDFFGVRG